MMGNEYERAVFLPKLVIERYDMVVPHGTNTCRLFRKCYHQGVQPTDRFEAQLLLGFTAKPAATKRMRDAQMASAIAATVDHFPEIIERYTHLHSLVHTVSEQALWNPAFRDLKLWLSTKTNTPPPFFDPFFEDDPVEVP